MSRLDEEVYYSSKKDEPVSHEELAIIGKNWIQSVFVKK